jgi:hypothetical protein
MSGVRYLARSAPWCWVYPLVLRISLSLVLQKVVRSIDVSMPLSLENQMSDNQHIPWDDEAMFQEILSRIAKTGAFMAASGMLTACENLPDGRLQYRDGVLVACVDVSEKKEDKCYKVEEDKPLPPKGAETPE